MASNSKKGMIGIIICSILLVVALVFSIVVGANFSNIAMANATPKATVTKTQASSQGMQSAQNIEAEGAVLLKNANNTLPLNKESGKTKVTVLGDSFIKTGNEDLDIVIAEKTLYCKKYGILLSCIIDGRQLSFMSSGDVYSLFGNAFDNAVECLKTQPEEKRVISLSVQIKGKFLGVCMENYCGKKLAFSGGLPVTDKPDKDYHGFGMKSMRYITEKYGGSLLAEQRGDMFVLSIMFPKNEKNNTLKS